MYKRIVHLLLISLFLPGFYVPTKASTHSFLFKKKVKTTVSTPPPPSKYKKLTGRDSTEWKGVMNVVKKGEDFYLEIPLKLANRSFLVVNRLQRVPKELNESGVNKGINYESGMISFQWNKGDSLLDIREQRVKPEVNLSDRMARSIDDNYINPLLCRLPIEAKSPDSSSVLIKVNSLWNGTDVSLNDAFNSINIPNNANSKLSKIQDIKAFQNSVAVTSELTTVVHEGTDHVNISIVVSSTLFLLPERPMATRLENNRVGFFTVPQMEYSDQQQGVVRKNYITRWRLEPKDKDAYLQGKLSEPVKPITFYLDTAIPEYLKPYIKKGILQWNTAFEKAGFANAIRVESLSDSLKDLDDDMKYSTLTYAASTKSNAMGPSTIDPRTGEILEADVIWWHNVVALLKEWITVQTGPYNPAAQSDRIPEELIGEAAQFVASHEVGHSLGLRHNMMASNAIPTDSLRSASFLKKLNGTSYSIMDYARFNYVAQPEDNVPIIVPHIGSYDAFAVEWGYRWFPDAAGEQAWSEEFLNAHTAPEFRHSETQGARDAIDPRALSEDLGDDAMRSATYGIQNLKRIVPNLRSWALDKSDKKDDWQKVSDLYDGVVGQWSLYLYHVLANVGGMYLDVTTPLKRTKAYTYVEKERQKRAVQFLIDQVFTFPEWLFGKDISDYMFVHRGNGREIAPFEIWNNSLSFLLWDIMTNERLLRMTANERDNGTDAFTAVDLMDMLHRHFFKNTLRGASLTPTERHLQKSFIDLLITAANETEGVKINKHLTDDTTPPAERHHWCSAEEERAINVRKLEFGNTQSQRVSDAISVKRGELLRIRQLLQAKAKTTADTATRYHYEDLLMRIKTALKD